MTDINLIYLSRNYTEFGPFNPEEIRAFHERGILDTSDFIRYHGEDDWLPAGDWLAQFSKPKKTSGAIKMPAAKKAATKKTVAKKAAKKAPTK
jgi:hypothetical protein